MNLAGQARMAASVLGKRRNINMPGCNENLLNQQNKRVRAVDHKIDRTNVDTPQMTISITTVNLAPPLHRDGREAPDDELYAPMSTEPLANVPVRGDLAFTAPGDGRWMSQVVTSAVNAYGKAIPIFSNMGGIKKGTKMKYVGIVGNAGMGKKGNDEQDKYGQVYGGGAVTCRNSGPGFIPPCSLVYASPFAYTINETNGVHAGTKRPGYQDSSESSTGIDKYRPATYAIQDSDAAALFHHIKVEMKKFAENHFDAPFTTDIGHALDNAVCALGIHRHIPAFEYAIISAYMAKAKLIMQKFNDHYEEVFENAIMNNKIFAAHFKRCFQRFMEFGLQFSTEQENASIAVGGPVWNMSKDVASWQNEAIIPLCVDVGEAKKDIVLLCLKEYQKLAKLYMDAHTIAFSEQINFMRAYVIGRSRYGSPPGAQLDVVTGYALN